MTEDAAIEDTTNYRLSAQFCEEHVGNRAWRQRQRPTSGFVAEIAPKLIEESQFLAGHPEFAARAVTYAAETVALLACDNPNHSLLPKARENSRNLARTVRERYPREIEPRLYDRSELSRPQIKSSHPMLQLRP